MARTTRERIRRSVQPPGGSFTGFNNGSAFSYSNTDVHTFYGISYCADSHGRPVQASALEVQHDDPSFMGTVNGDYAGPGMAPGWKEGHARNYLPTYFRVLFPGHNDLSIPSESADMAKLLARTNPSRPQYVPLDLLQDLVEIPKMLREAGSFLNRRRKRIPITPKDIANQHLAFEFGWLPLVQDLKDLLGVNKYVQQRMGELERLYSDQGLKRRLRLGNWTNFTDSHVYLESDQMLTILARESTNTVARRWGTVRWKPTGTFAGYRPEHAEMLRQAEVAVSGFTTAGLFEGAWDLIPWTFLIDWGVNVKDYVLQYANQIPAAPSDACIMTETTTIRSWSVESITPGYQFTPGFRTRTSKIRYVGSGTLSAHIPMLDMGRLAILGSLAVQRFSR